MVDSASSGSSSANSLKACEHSAVPVCQAFGGRSPLEHYVAKAIEDMTKSRAVGTPLNDFKVFPLEKPSQDRSIVATEMTHISIPDPESR